MTKNEVKILIVDDSDFSRATISQMLGEGGFNVIGEAGSAKEALHLMRDRQAHILIVDIVMPEISGIELCQTINENFNDVNIIMTSSLAQESIIIEAISAGATDFIQKPFTKETLFNSVEKIIAGLAED